MKRTDKTEFLVLPGATDNGCTKHVALVDKAHLRTMTIRRPERWCRELSRGQRLFPFETITTWRTKPLKRNLLKISENTQNEP